MATIPEQILINIKSTLENVEGFDSTSVRRFKQVGQTYNSVPVIDVIYGGIDFSDQKNNAQTYELSVSLILVDRDESDNSDGVMDSYIEKITNELLTDQSRGGLALRTYIQGIEPFPVEEGEPEIIRAINLKILYRVFYNNHSING